MQVPLPERMSTCKCDACLAEKGHAANRAADLQAALNVASDLSGVPSDRITNGIKGSPALVQLYGDRAVRVARDYGSSVERYRPLLDQNTWPKLKYFPRLLYGKRVGPYNVTVMDRYIVSPHLSEIIPPDEYNGGASAWDFHVIAEHFPDLMPDVYKLRKEIGNEAYRLGLPIPGDTHWYNLGWTKSGEVKLIDFWL